MSKETSNGAGPASAGPVRKISVKEVTDGVFIFANIEAPDVMALHAALDRYFLDYPVEGYATEVKSEESRRDSASATVRRYRSCD